jgi:hypothetical protein
MCRASGAEAVRAVQEVLFLEGLQHHDHRPLKDFVFKSGNSQWSDLGGRAGLGNVSSSHRGCIVRAGLGSIQQRLEVVLQIHCVVFGRLSVNASSAVLAGPVVGLRQPVDVHEIGPGCEPHLGTLPSEFRDPLLFCGHGSGFRCTRHVSLQRCHDLASPSLHGVPRVVPPLPRYYGTLRLPAVPLDPFDFFTSRYHRVARGLLPSVVGVPPGARELSVPVSHPD